VEFTQVYPKDTRDTTRRHVESVDKVTLRLNSLPFSI